MLFTGAFGELTDRGVSPKTERILTRALNPLLPSSPPPTESITKGYQAHSRSHNSDSVVPIPPPLLGIRDLRAMRAGATMFVDVIADVPPTMTMRDAAAIEGDITKKLKSVRREISEVRVKFNVVDKETNDVAH